jgi:uncharacterized protein
MAVEVVDNPAKHRFEILVDGTRAGSAFYTPAPDRVVFTHTEVDDAYEGQGLGSRLAAAALDASREAHLAVVPVCEFIAGYIQQHPEYVDLVPEEVRARHGL